MFSHFQEFSKHISKIIKDCQAPGKPRQNNQNSRQDYQKLKQNSSEFCSGIKA